MTLRLFCLPVHLEQDPERRRKQMRMRYEGARWALAAAREAFARADNAAARARVAALADACAELVCAMSLRESGREWRPRGGRVR